MHAYPGRTFGQLYHRFFRTNDLADGRFAVTGGTLDLADVRVPVLSVAGRGDGIAPVAACHHVESLLRNAQVRARDGAGRPPRRADRPRRGRVDVADPRRVPRRARSCKAPCTAGKTAGGRCLSGYPSRPMRALAPLTTLLLLLVLAAPAAAQTPPLRSSASRPGSRPAGSTSATSRSGRPRSSSSRPTARSSTTAISVHLAGRQFRLTPQQSKLKFDTILTAKRALLRGAHEPRRRRPARHQREQGAHPDLRPQASAARSTSRRATPRSASRCATSSAARRVTGRSLDVKALRATLIGDLRQPAGPAPHPPEPQDPPGARADERPRARLRDGHHDRPRQLQAAPVQAAEVLQELRRRRRPAGLPDADRALPDLQQAGQPGLDRAELALGGRARRDDDARRRRPRTRCGPGGWGSPGESASTGPRRSIRSAAALRTAASACASRT